MWAGFRSRHYGVVQFVMFDGSVRGFSNTSSSALRQAIGSIAGNEVNIEN